jgi:uncharacterized protein DUF2798
LLPARRHDLARAGTALASQEVVVNLRIPRRHGHFVFGVIQSGLTCLVAAGIASYPESGPAAFIQHWLVSWLISWLTMLPVVLLAAPVIRAFVNHLTHD